MLKIGVHPGEVLKDELAEHGVTLTELSRQIAVPTNRISMLIQGKRSMTADTALRLGHWFGMDPRFWMSLQAQFDLVGAEQRSGAAIKALPTTPKAEGRPI